MISIEETREGFLENRDEMTGTIMGALTDQKRTIMLGMRDVMTPNDHLTDILEDLSLHLITIAIDGDRARLVMVAPRRGRLEGDNLHSHFLKFAKFVFHVGFMLRDASAASTYCCFLSLVHSLSRRCHT